MVPVPVDLKSFFSESTVGTFAVTVVYRGNADDG